MRNLFTKLKGIVKQFIPETIALILISAHISIKIIQNKHLYIILFDTLMLGITLYLSFIFCIKKIAIKITSKKNGKILQLTHQNAIGMKPQKIKKYTDFKEDIDDFIEYAQNENIPILYAKTHKILALELLHTFVKARRKEIYSNIENLKINDTYTEHTKFGRIEVTYIGKEINICNRYNDNKKGFKKILEEKDTYEIKLHIEAS